MKEVSALVLTLCILFFFACVVQGAIPPPCPKSNTNSFMLPVPAVRMHGNSDVVQQCVFQDLNGDGLMDYVCSYQEDPDPATFDLNCVYQNTGKGWLLIAGNGVPQ